MTDVHQVVPFRALSDSEAIEWLVAHAPVTASNAELARTFGWNDAKVSRRLAAWRRDGRVVRELSGLMGGEPAVDKMAGFSGSVAADAPQPAALESAPMSVEAAELEHVPAVVETPIAVVPPASAIEHCGSRGHRLVAYATAVAVTVVGGYFSVTGMPELFPGAAVAVMVLAATMEGAKLVLAGFVAHQWAELGMVLRVVLAALTVGLAGINGAGVFGRLAEAHVGPHAVSASAIDERIGSIDACLNAQRAAVADFERRLAQVDGAVEEATRRGRTKSALELAANAGKARAELAAGRQREAAVLADLEGQRAGLITERTRVEVARGPIMFLAAIAGVDVEVAIRWLMLAIVLCCDPVGIALTVAASRRRLPSGG